MSRISPIPLALAAAVALAACDTPTGAPGQGPAAAAPSASTASAPAAGPRLLAVTASGPDRFQTVEFLLHLDAEHGLMAVHAPSNFCQTFQVGVVDVQEVSTPSAIEQRIVQTKGEGLPLTVYRASSFADAGIEGSFDFAGFGNVLANLPAFCAFLAGPDRVAEGTVRRVANLSNASFAVSWTGQLERVGGGTVMLTELYQLIGDAQEPSDASQWSVSASKVLLH